MKRVRLILTGALLFSITMGFSQTLLDWSDLKNNIQIQSAGDALQMLTFSEASFSSKFSDLEGKKIGILGYLLILKETPSGYLLSENPMASCFFCGNGGPESIVELRFEQKPGYKMDDLVLVEGTLKLNRDNPENCYYIIENAEAWKPF